MQLAQGNAGLTPRFKETDLTRRHNGPLSRKVPSEVGVATAIPRRVLSKQGRYAFSRKVLPDEAPTHTYIKESTVRAGRTALFQGKCCPTRHRHTYTKESTVRTGPTRLFKESAAGQRADTHASGKAPPEHRPAPLFQGKRRPTRCQHPYIKETLPDKAPAPHFKETANDAGPGSHSHRGRPPGTPMPSFKTTAARAGRRHFKEKGQSPAALTVASRFSASADRLAGSGW